MAEPQNSITNMRKERLLKEDGRFLYLYRFDESPPESSLNRSNLSVTSAKEKKRPKEQKTARK